jgi:energy-coupling factor transport system permease protein
MRTAIGRYYPADSPLHRVDPRAKFVAVLALAVALFTRDSFAALAVYGAAALVAFVISRVPPLWFWRGLKPVLWLIVLTFVAQVLLARGVAFYSVGPFHLTRRGLELATYLSLRLVVLILFGSLLTLTTSPIALTDALAWLGRPLRRLRVPSDELALMMTIALRFIPTWSRCSCPSLSSAFGAPMIWRWRWRRAAISRGSAGHASIRWSSARPISWCSVRWSH